MSSERYSPAYSTAPRFLGEKYTYCGRTRCEERIILQDDKYKNRYPAYTVVVSLNDGETKKAFCSEKCAAQWLNTYSRKMKE